MKRKYKPKPISEWGLCKKSEKKVKKELEKWINHFIELANGQEGNIYRANFIDMDIFYFTDCNDILENDPEAAGQETNLEIRNRKRMVLLQLFLKTLINGSIKRKIKCSHCGYNDMFINGINNFGHYMFCPKCKYTKFGTYPNFYESMVQGVKKDILKHKYSLEICK